MPVEMLLKVLLFPILKYFSGYWPFVVGDRACPVPWQRTHYIIHRAILSNPTGYHPAIYNDKNPRVFVTGKFFWLQVSGFFSSANSEISDIEERDEQLMAIPYTKFLTTFQ